MAADWKFIVESTSATEGYWKIIIRRPENAVPEKDAHGPIVVVDGDTYTFRYREAESPEARDEWNSGIPSSRSLDFDLRIIVDGSGSHREVVPVKGSGGGGPGGSTDAKRQKPKFIRSK